ncbi:MAG TPA: integrase core domain-containing protein [Actinomycetota bacterium]
MSASLSRVVLRHDNGTQFTSYLYHDVAAALDVKLSRTAYRHPDGTASIERTFLSQKTECVWPEEFENLEQALAAITAWVAPCNTERPHQSLGYATPEGVRRAGITNPTLTAA